MLSIFTLLLFGVAAVASIRRRSGWQIPLGLLLSAAGDAAGAMGWFVPQMGLFAAALGCYLCEMVPHIGRKRVRPAWPLAILLPLVAGVALLADHIEPIGEAVGVVLYALLLLSLVAAALLQQRPYRGWLLCAALLFLLSDALIGYTRYVAPLHSSKGWILLFYGTAQLLFALWSIAAPDKVPTKATSR